MKGRYSWKGYCWAIAEAQLADGIHPAVVAARLGEPTERVFEEARKNHWPIMWDHSTAIVGAGK